MYRYPEGWIADDFADTLSLEPKEDDPWAVQSRHDETVSDSPSGDHEAKVLGSEFTGDSDSDSSEASVQDSERLDAPWPLDGESYQEWKILLRWDEEQPSSIRPVEPDTLSDMEVDYSSLEEPEPLPEYNSELGQPLHGSDYDILGLPRAIKVNQWIASIDEASDAQLQEITELLTGFNEARLRSWLPWLREHEWTGHSLLLFFQFRAFWDENPELWEAAGTRA